MSELVAENLVKKYKNKVAVDQVSLKLSRGEIVGLLGANGAGKTTIFYMMVGLIRPNNGKISIDEKNITRQSISARAKLGLGYLPQDSSIFRKLSVEENILAILQLRKNLTKAQQKEQLEKLLKEFHIKHIRNSIGYSLSGGERKRVEIARALATDPNFILFDEPFSGVDPISIIDIKHIFGHLRDRGVGVLLTDHNVREALDICERAYIVDQGKLICDGAPRDILKNETVRKVYLGDDFNL